MFNNSKHIYNLINKSHKFCKVPNKGILNSAPLYPFSNTIKPIKTDETYKNNEDVKKYMNNNFGQKGYVKVLEELLDLKSLVAKDVIIRNRKFCKVSSTVIEENYKLCQKNGILIETLQQFPDVLAESDICLKMKELKEMPYDINITTPLLCLPYKRLKTYVQEEMKSNRITLMSQWLEIEKFKVCQILSRRSFLLSLNLNQLTNNIKLLADNGITKDEIIKDLWVLSYSTNMINERLDLAKKNNIDIFKTWMVRAQLDIFETYIKRRSDNKLILGDSSLTQYLSERLECTEEVAKYIISKLPALQNKSLKKMNEIIDYLFKYGFKPIHICRVPKILLHSVETTRKRLKELEAKGMHLDSLYILTKSQKQYMQYYESLVKTGKNKMKDT